MIFLPEASDFIAKDSEETLSLTLPIDDNPFVNGIKDAAMKRNMWVSMGIHESVMYLFFRKKLYMCVYFQSFILKGFLFRIRVMTQKEFIILIL